MATPYPKKLAYAAVQWAGYAILVAVFVGIPLVAGFRAGKAMGHATGYVECVSDTVFPSASELEKVRRYFRDDS